MLVSMIKTFNEDYTAGCEGVELAPLQYTTYELQPLDQSQQIEYTYCRWSIRSIRSDLFFTNLTPNLVNNSVVIVLFPQLDFKLLLPLPNRF